MTANELIDKIEKIQNNKENIDWYVLQFVVPMLRQQQAEIEKLKLHALTAKYVEGFNAGKLYAELELKAASEK